MDGGDAGGRVRVFTRVRPLGPQEDGIRQPVVELGEASQTVRVCADTVDVSEVQRPGQVRIAEGMACNMEAREFTFDGVFPSDVTQRQVYAEVGFPVLCECMRGVNGTIFAYGQTGSGKTHSLLHQGPPNDEAGLLPRLVAGLFVHTQQDVESVYEVEAAALQVYNEQIDDLLHPDHEVGVGHNLSVQNGGVVVGLTWVRCENPEDTLNAFTRARSNVVYAETRMNKASSRSHAVFQLRVTRRGRLSADDASGGSRRVECTRGRLLVVDLAGSERVKKSGVEGAQFKEAAAINRSLLALGNVVSALAAVKPHVPYRDSKLTRVLEGSLGGNCRTVLLVCVSPAAEQTQETLSSLEFATRAMRVQVDAKINTCVVEVDAKALLADLNVDMAESSGVHALQTDSLLASLAAEEDARAAMYLREEALLGSEHEACRRSEAAQMAEVRWRRRAEDVEQQLQNALGQLAGLREECRHNAEAHAEEASRANAAVSLQKAQETLAAESARNTQAALEALQQDLRRQAEDAERQMATEQQAFHEQLHCVEAKAETMFNQCSELEEGRVAVEAELSVCSGEMRARAEETARAMRTLEVLREEASSQNAAHRTEIVQFAEAAKAARLSALASARQEADLKHRRQSEEALAALAEERFRRDGTVATLEADRAKQTERWQREKREADTELGSLRGEMEQELQACRDAYERRMGEMRRRTKGERAEWRRHLDEQRSEYQRAEQHWERARQDAISNAMEQGGAQHRRLAAAFKEARSLSLVREEELQEARDSLAKRVEELERPRIEDAQLIAEQQARIGQLQEELRHGKLEVDTLRRDLRNREHNDRLFGCAEFRRCRAESPGGSCGPTPTPPLPGARRVNDAAQRAGGERPELRRRARSVQRLAEHSQSPRAWSPQHLISAAKVLLEPSQQPPPLVAG